MSRGVAVADARGDWDADTDGETLEVRTLEAEPLSEDDALYESVANELAEPERVTEPLLRVELLGHAVAAGVRDCCGDALNDADAE